MNTSKELTPENIIKELLGLNSLPPAKDNGEFEWAVDLSGKHINRALKDIEDYALNLSEGNYKRLILNLVVPHRTTEDEIKVIYSDECFVFSSNEAGIHGAGTALTATNWGARGGRGFGVAGDTFAIPTKDLELKSLPLKTIAKYVRAFVGWAKDRPETTFFVTEIGYGLAGYTATEIAPMFKGVIELSNVHLPKRFWNVLLK